MENTYLKATKFDEMVTDKNMWIMKALIPYLPPNISSPLSIYAKISELDKTLRFTRKPLHAAAKKEFNLPELLSIIKDYGSDAQAENIEMILMMLELMNSPDSSPEMMESMMNMFMNNGSEEI
ncbi:MAG: hypothetical protein ACI4DS_00335 [Eubacterium sp.]